MSRTIYIAVNKPITLKDGTEIKKGKYNNVDGDFSDNEKITNFFYYVLSLQHGGIDYDNRPSKEFS